MKKYGIIYADPPWRYNARANTNTKFGGGAMGHYQVMSTDDICQLPIKNIADDNCALFLWATFPRLREALLVMESWGFDYKTIAFNWVKTNKNNNNPFFGIGYYTKSNSEVCLLGIKGKMKPVSNKVSSIIISPREEHSKKPSVARNRIVQLFGDLPRIELFARQRYLGWDCWGNEVGSDIELDEEIKKKVNCKDCKHKHLEFEDVWMCTKYERFANGVDEFCSQFEEIKK